MSQDENLLRALAGANFGPNASVVLPSGQKIDGAEAQALTSFYAADASKEQPVTEDMSTDAVSVRVRKALEDNEDWIANWYGDRGDIIDGMVGDITAAVTGDQPPVDAEPLPEPVLLRTFPLNPIRGGQVTEYRLQFEVQYQWLEIAAVVPTVEARSAEVNCYRVGDTLVCRIEAVDGAVYAQVARYLAGGW